ncbi:hypothetical protein BN903_131 [Halorubrum sp. AJ67]|nr:hypothetical protein BN903_131 [Halorubrum sp. AJ67]
MIGVSIVTPTKPISMNNRVRQSYIMGVVDKPSYDRKCSR